jgi:hypothetical protein
MGSSSVSPSTSAMVTSMPVTLSPKPQVMHSSSSTSQATVLPLLLMATSSSRPSPSMSPAAMATAASPRWVTMLVPRISTVVPPSATAAYMPTPRPRKSPPVMSARGLLPACTLAS